MLLFLTSQEHHVHADWMAAECERRGVSHLRLYTEQFPQEFTLTVQPQAGVLHGTIRLPQHAIPLDTITGIWHFLARPATPHPDLDEVGARLVWGEANSLLAGLYHALWDRRWVNPPHEAECHYKLYQLRLAAEVGFRTPPTLVTNQPEQAMAFLEQCGGEMLYKPMRPLMLVDEEGVPSQVSYVTLISRTEIEAQLDSVRVAPCMFQAFVPKDYEISVYVIGSRAWSTAIYSQGDEIEHKVDYRKNGLDGCPHVPIRLPPDVEARCIAMTHAMGLRACNFDLLHTPEGHYVFLDANPSEQWTLMEQLTELPLCAAIVDELLDVDTLSEHPYLRPSLSR